MPDLEIKYGTNNQAITITLASLGVAAMRESASISNTTNKFLDVLVGGKITTGTSPDADSAITFYAYGSVDGGTLYSGGASGSDAAFTGEVEQLFYLGSVTVDGTNNKTYEFGPFSVARAFGGVIPSNWGVIVLNGSGVALNATGINHDVNHQGIKGESV